MTLKTTRKRAAWNFTNPRLFRGRASLGLWLLALLLPALTAQAWWDKSWGGRRPVTIETGEAGGKIEGEVGETVVLVRLHQGNFPFGEVKEDGSDVRFVAEDDKTELAYEWEKYDGLMYEAYAWVKVPEVKAGGPTKLWMYYGNAEAEAKAKEAKGAYGEKTALVYHFGERGSAPVDASGNGNNGEGAGTVSEGSLIGGGVRLLGGDPIKIPASESLKWLNGGTWRWTAWVKPSQLADDAQILSRTGDGGNLQVGLAKGIPYVEVGGQRIDGAEAVAENTWHQLGVVAADGQVSLWVDGKKAGEVSAVLPASDAPFVLGGEEAGKRFVGELDELQISTAAPAAGYLAFTELNQSGREAANQLLVVGEAEGSGGGGGHSEAFEHIMLFGDIAKNMMFDGWVVVFVCAIMAVVGWFVAAKKFLYLRKIEKGSVEFLKQWRQVASDLTALDHTDAANVKSLGGKADEATQEAMKESPLYHIYHIGSEEIRYRLARPNGEFAGLSARSIQAIRASLDGGMVHEVHRLNGGLVFLTISIAGGPYVGLLGTVMGVMITFAVIAKTGEVEVNSIAPGIASALLATVAGLVVAIPALFIYSYLSSRIKEAISSMQVFIDEFVTKMAEYYPTPAEGGLPRRVERDVIDREVNEEARKS